MAISTFGLELRIIGRAAEQRILNILHYGVFDVPDPLDPIQADFLEKFLDGWTATRQNLLLACLSDRYTLERYEVRSISAARKVTLPGPPPRVHVDKAYHTFVERGASPIAPAASTNGVQVGDASPNQVCLILRNRDISGLRGGRGSNRLGPLAEGDTVYNAPSSALTARANALGDALETTIPATIGAVTLRFFFALFHPTQVLLLPNEAPAPFNTFLTAIQSVFPIQLLGTLRSRRPVPS